MKSSSSVATVARCDGTTTRTQSKQRATNDQESRLTLSHIANTHTLTHSLFLSLSLSLSHSHSHSLSLSLCLLCRPSIVYQDIGYTASVKLACRERRSNRARCMATTTRTSKHHHACTTVYNSNRLVPYVVHCRPSSGACSRAGLPPPSCKSVLLSALCCVRLRCGYRLKLVPRNTSSY